MPIESVGHLRTASTCCKKFSVKISMAKCATEPALEVGRSAASPTAKMLSVHSCERHVSVIDGHKIEIVGEASSLPRKVCPHVDWHRHQ